MESSNWTEFYPRTVPTSEELKLKRPYVYLIENRIDGALYVGESTANTGRPWHKYMGSGTVLHAAYKHYGIENFDKWLIEFIPHSGSERKNHRSACQRETFHIGQLDASGARLYNAGSNVGWLLNNWRWDGWEYICRLCGALHGYREPGEEQIVSNYPATATRTSVCESCWVTNRFSRLSKDRNAADTVFDPIPDVSPYVANMAKLFKQRVEERHHLWSLRYEIEKRSEWLAELNWRVRHFMGGIDRQEAEWDAYHPDEKYEEVEYGFPVLPNAGLQKPMRPLKPLKLGGGE